MASRLLAVLAICAFAIASADARPAKWCGWYARHNLVSTDPGKRFNSACAWRTYGTAASDPAIGVLVVWCSARHRHVGKIVGRDANGNWLVRSGNDGHAVRTRARSVAGAVFRWPR